MENITIFSPLQGRTMPLSKIADQRFSKEHFGPGIVILPRKNFVYAPFDGILISIAENRHGLWFRSKEGIELLVHVGLDTVFLNGECFSTIVEPGASVSCGQAVMEFDRKRIRQKGFSTATPVVVTNPDLPGTLQLTKKRHVNPETVLMYVSCS